MVKKSNEGLAIAGLILNILILPGLGTLIGGGPKLSGILQIILFILGVILTFTVVGALIGIPLMIGMWIWALVSGITLVKKSK